jgi:exodeoxyribonuclease VII small subunit
MRREAGGFACTMKKPKEYEESVEHFDQHLERLRAIVEKMEQGGLGLDESLKLFEEGIQLSRRLFDMLNRSEGRVEELLATMEKVPFTRADE